MTKIITLIGILLFIGCSTKPELESSCFDYASLKQQIESSKITFILSEGTFGNVNGGLWGVKDNSIQQLPGNPTGNTSTSMVIHNDNLYIVNNVSATMLKYEISDLGVVKPTCESLDLNGSSPREILVINDKAYISQWNVYGIAVIDLPSFTKTNTIPVNGHTEGLAFDGTHLFAAIAYDDYSEYSSGSSLVKINLTSNSVEKEIQVSDNPQQLIFHDGYIYVSSIQYGDWPDPNSYSTEKIDPVSDKVVAFEYYGNTLTFGNDFAIHNDTVYRACDKGIVALNLDLSIDMSTYIGTEYPGLYSMAINDNLIYLGFGDYISPDNVVVLDFDGNEVSNFEVGASPGSFAFWKSE